MADKYKLIYYYLTLAMALKFVGEKSTLEVLSMTLYLILIDVSRLLEGYETN